MKKLLLLFAAVAFAFTGCYENTGPDTPNVGDITLSYNSMNVDAMGGDFSVDVTADYPFEASTNADWIHITAIGRNTLSFIVAENSTNAEREGIITIFCDSYNLSATLTITQKGRETSPNNEIWYTSSNGSVVEPYITDAFGVNIVSNTYANGKGVIVFDAPVTSIGDSAFRDCTSLTSVTIPDSVTSIGNDAFYDCSSLTSVTIGDSVTSIGISVFSGCTSLTSVIIPDSVTKIGGSAFEYCTSLTSVTIGNGVTSIREQIFIGCISLKAFYGKFASSDNRCLIVDGVLTSFAPAGLTEYTIPDSVTSIGVFAFAGCTSLTSVTIGNSVTEIVYGAFYACGSLTSVTIPDSVTSIGEAAFEYCISLTSVTIPDSVTKIGGSAFEYCTSLTNVTIGNSVTLIGDYAFYDCSSLTSVAIGDSVTSIGGSAFAGCTSLTSVTIGDRVTSIGNNAFNGCTSLTSVTIGDSVTSIGHKAFNGCTSLNEVYCKPITPPTAVSGWGWSAFNDNASGRKIYVPTNSVDAYKAAEYWSNYADYIVGYDF